ncbi:hypothetical protein CEXT_525671 [Caerostris extrusa]|uniref:Uncharacterized protein n=1 Tax=Caerostris extrusa TaxID=172846 RepID=A0AAV4MQE4_CAEEX|nr:hypothetical protein CEXT_525671 [Caerostris extrusa]
MRENMMRKIFGMKKKEEGISFLQHKRVYAPMTPSLIYGRDREQSWEFRLILGKYLLVFTTESSDGFADHGTTLLSFAHALTPVSYFPISFPLSLFLATTLDSLHRFRICR